MDILLAVLPAGRKFLLYCLFTDHRLGWICQHSPFMTCDNERSVRTRHPRYSDLSASSYILRFLILYFYVYTYMKYIYIYIYMVWFSWVLLFLISTPTFHVRDLVRLWIQQYSDLSPLDFYFLFIYCFGGFFVYFILFIYFLYSRFLLVIYFIHTSVYMSIPTSQFIPPPPPPAPPLSPLGVHTFVLYICVSISALQTGSSLPFC